MLYLIPLAESVLPVHVLDAVGHGPAVHQLECSPLVASSHTVDRLNRELPDVLIWNEKWNMPEWSVVKCTRLKWEMKYAWMVSYQMSSSELRNEIHLNGQMSGVFVWNEKWNTPEWSDARYIRLKWEMKYAWMVGCQMYSPEMRNEIRLNGQLSNVLVWNEKWNTHEWSATRCPRLNWEMKYTWMVGCQVYSSEMRNEIHLNGQMPGVFVWNEKWNTPEWSAARCTRLKWEMK